MYTRFADGRKMRVELLSESENEAGGYKDYVDITRTINGG